MYFKIIVYHFWRSEYLSQVLNIYRGTNFEKGRGVLWHNTGSSTFYSDFGAMLKSLGSSFKLLSIRFWCVLSFDFAMWLWTFRLDFLLSSVILWFNFWIPYELGNVYTLYKWSCFNLGGGNREFQNKNHLVFFHVTIADRCTRNIKCKKVEFSFFNCNVLRNLLNTRKICDIKDLYIWYVHDFPPFFKVIMQQRIICVLDFSSLSFIYNYLNKYQT